jgi:hypothetical protein
VEKNVTITMEEELLRWARVWAAERGSSVSRLVNELVRERMLGEDEYEQARRDYLRAAP